MASLIQMLKDAIAVHDRGRNTFNTYAFWIKKCYGFLNKPGSQWRHLRWKLADVLSFLACRLRGQKWYIGNCMADVPGNRAAELKQRIWESCVVLNFTAESKDKEWLDMIDRELTELGQIAGENWGHDA